MTEQEKYLREVTLPEATETYTVISHGHIIDTVRTELAKNGFEIDKEVYAYSHNGEIALGKVYIKTEKDPQMGMIFTWWNSYNKQVKFGCAVGSFIYDNNASLIGSEGMSWIRKHTGTADQEADNIIEQLISHANMYFDKLITEKNTMMQCPLTKEDFGCIMGALYFEHELITPNQASAIKKEYHKPEHTYTHKETLWGLYKLLMFGIEGMDIKKWARSQQKLHHMIMTEYAINVEIPETITMETADGQKIVAEVDPVHDISKGEPAVSIEPIVVDFSEEEPKMEVVDPQPTADVIAITDGVAQPLEEVTEPSEVDAIVEQKTVSKRTAVQMAGEQTHAKALVDYWMGEHYDDAKTFEENVNAFKDWAPEPSEKKAKEPIVDLSEIEGTYTVDEIPAVIEKVEEKIAEVKDERQEWADKVLEEGDPNEHVGPPEMYQGDELAQWANEAEAVSPLPETVIEESSEEVVEIVEGDSDVEMELASIFGEDPEQAVEVEEETVAEEPKPSIEPVANLDKPVEIMSPKESKEKSSDEFVFPTDLDNPEKLEKELTVEKKEEEEEFLDVEEHDGLQVPEGVVAQAATIEKKMSLLYGSVRPYQVQETDTQINVIIDETFESFYIKK